MSFYLAFMDSVTFIRYVVREVGGKILPLYNILTLFLAHFGPLEATCDRCRWFHK